jgi:hypothetical protein
MRIAILLGLLSSLSTTTTAPALEAHATRMHCTSEPIERVRLQPRSAAAAGTLRVDVLGPPALCDGGPVIALVGADAIELVHLPLPEVASACGTCALRIDVAGVAAGSHRVRMDGTTARARAR